MQNPLDEIYAKYRHNKRMGITGQVPSKKETTPQGVPSPVLDGESDPDTSTINTCPKCGGMNVSLDIGTNKITCRDCNEPVDKPTKVDFRRKMEQLQEEEIEQMKKAVQQGQTFNFGGPKNNA